MAARRTRPRPAPDPAATDPADETPADEVPGDEAPAAAPARPGRPVWMVPTDDGLVPEPELQRRG